MLVSVGNIYLDNKEVKFVSINVFLIENFFKLLYFLSLSFNSFDLSGVTLYSLLDIKPSSFLGDTTLSIRTLSIKTLSMKTLSMKTLSMK
jgi:hypothetical protein